MTRTDSFTVWAKEIQRKFFFGRLRFSSPLSLSIYSSVMLGFPTTRREEERQLFAFRGNPENSRYPTDILED
jgi:hypothetical protein